MLTFKLTQSILKAQINKWGSILLLLTLLFNGTLKGQDIFLRGKYVEIGIHQAFSFGSSVAPPAGLNLHHRTNNGNGLGFVCDYDKNGWTSGNPGFMGDYFTPGNPVEGWGVEWNGSINKRNFPIASSSASHDILNSKFVRTANGSNIGVIWEGTTSNGANQKMLIQQTLTLDTNSTYFTVTVNLKNTGTQRLTDVKYWRSVDPDNEKVLPGCNYKTNNKILKQVGFNGNTENALVEARGPVHNVPIFLGAIDSRALVSRKNFINFNPSDIISNAESPGTATLADLSINVAFSVGDIDVGECKIFTFFYALSDRDINKVDIPLSNDFSFKRDIFTTREICTDSLVTFYDFSSGPGSQYISKNEWDFDDDGIFDRTGDSATWSYSTFGKHVVNKRITLCNNVVFDTTITVDIKPNVHASFDAQDSTFCRNIDTVDFKNTSRSAIALLHEWRLEDGSKINTTNLQRTFPSDSVYRVELVSFNNKGCRDSVTLTKRAIVHHIPEANFSIKDSSRCNNDFFNFTNLSSIASGTMKSTWTIGAVLEEEDSVNLTNVIIAVSDTLNVKLVQTSGFGCKDSASKVIIILPAPVSDFTFSAKRLCSKNNAFIFTDSSTGNDRITRMDWNLGDGSLDTGRLVSKSYSSADTFTVKHTVFNNYGCQNTSSLEVIIDSMPKASFSINDANQCENENSYTFTNLSSTHYGTIESNWKIGDSLVNNTSNVANFKFAQADSVAIELAISNVNGCKDTVSQMAIILPSPRARFTINKDSQCLNGQNFEVENTSTLKYGSASHVWKYETFEETNDKITLKKYSTNGDYTIRLVVLSDSNCTDSIEKDIFINPEPVLGFTINDSSQCLGGNMFDFTNTTQFKNDPSISTKWTAEDLSSHTGTDWLNKSFAKDDTFNVTLLIETRLGCNNSLTRKVILNPMPVASTSVNDTGQCLNENYFINQSTSTIKSGVLNRYSWNFGDGTTRAGATDSVHHRFLNHDTFTIQHIVRSALNCADTTSVVYIVHPSPTASFTVADTFICFNFPYNFTNTSTIPQGALNYKWDLNDGTTSDSVDIKNKIYGRWGSYFPRLVATSNLLCRDTVSLRVEVAPKPSASFNRTTDSAQCLKANTYSFLNTSTVDSGTIVSNKWNLGDGSAIVENQHLNDHNYARDSTYTITLIIESNQGCIDTSTKVASIWPQADVSFTTNDSGQCFNDQLFNFTNQSKISKGTLSYQWILGNGNIDTTDNVIGEKYAIGASTVRLISTSNRGCKDTLDRRIIVHPNTQPNFDIDTLFGCFKSNQFTFDNRSTLADGTMDIRWDFGDSTFNIIANTVTKKFNRPDTFTIELMTATNMDCFDSISKSVVVHHDPKANFSLNTDRFCFNNQQFSAFNISSIVSGTETARIHWGDNTQEPIGDTLVHIYARTDSFTVSVVSTSDNLCKDTMDLFVIVDSMPTADFVISQANQCFTGNDFRFTNTSSSHRDTLAHSWHLGDGTTSTLSDINSKTYAIHDSMIVKLVATNIFSCMDSISKPIIVYPQPEAAFSISDDRQCFDQHTFDFTNTSKANVGVNTTQWTFNFGLLDTNTDVTNWTWITSDTFAVRQLVTNSSGCIDSLVKQIIIDPEPTVAFAINDNRQCFDNNSFTQINLSTANVGTNTYRWDMGDKTSLTSTDVVSYSYGTFDSFTIKLIATNSEGCADSASQLVIVDEMPEAIFTINDVEQCLRSNNYQYTNASTTAFGNLANTWTLESLGRINRVNIDTNYASSDTFSVKLMVETATGCLDSTTKEVIVRPMPTANYTISDVAQCFKNNTVDFTNTSSIKYGILNHQWFLGDGDTSTSENITNKNFGTVDTFFNKLVSISAFGCDDTIIKEVYIHPNPQANFTINDNDQCFSKQSFNYTNTSVVQYNRPMTFSWNLGDTRIRASTNVNALQYATAGNYRVLLEARSDLNCLDTLSKAIIVLSKPVASFSTRDSSQCLIGNSFNMDNTSTADIGTVTSVWTLQDGTRFTSDDINNKSFDRDGVYTVQLIVEDVATCADTFENNVIVHPHPVAIIQASNTCINEPFTISAASTIKNTAIVKTTWDFGDGTQASTSNPIKYFGNAANYLVRLTEESDQGCQHDTSQMVTVWAKPNAGFTSTKFRSRISEVEYQYTDQSTTTIDQWLWEFGDGQISNSQNPSITYSDTGTYFTQLIVRNNDGCLDTARIGPDFIAPDFILYIPNVFSPNGDGKNDAFGPVISKYVLSYNMVIYNRWGQRMFESKDGSLWDGNYNNKLAPQSTYVFRISAIDLYGVIHTKEGPLHLLR